MPAIFNLNFGLTLSGGFRYTSHSPIAQVAQSVEQRTENPRVGSSILSLGTRKIKGPRFSAWPFFICKEDPAYLLNFHTLSSFHFAFFA